MSQETPSLLSQAGQNHVLKTQQETGITWAPTPSSRKSGHGFFTDDPTGKAKGGCSHGGLGAPKPDGWGWRVPPL